MFSRQILLALNSLLELIALSYSPNISADPLPKPISITWGNSSPIAISEFLKFQTLQNNDVLSSLSREQSNISLMISGSVDV